MSQEHKSYYLFNNLAGNMTTHDHFQEGCSRQMCWDGENRLVSFSDHCKNTGFYQYDAGGERTYKLTWTGSTSNRSGDRSIYYTPDEATLYASPYLVATPHGYTKHYYAEAERITSQLGRGKFDGISASVVGDSLVQTKLQAVTGNMLYPSTMILPDSAMLAYLDTLVDRQSADATIYYYHPDHLGSSSWITTTNGKVTQHLHYLPWGENYVNQHDSDFDGVRYTFSAKEKDTETGYSYFGSRYYSSDLSIWPSVDPQAAKYPSLSPYTYCANNPVKLVDPNGEDIWTIYDDGTISRQKNTKIDRIDVVDKDKIVTKGTEAKYGTIKQHTRNFGDTRIDFFDINDDALATEAFENIANNTSMEWTHAKIGEEGSNRNIVGTSHSTNSTAVGDFLLKTGYTLREVNHNHPSGLAWPSGNEFGAVKGDIPHAKEYEAKFPNIRLNIYVNGKDPRSQVFEWYKKGYHPYTQHSPTVQQ